MSVPDIEAISHQCSGGEKFWPLLDWELQGLHFQSILDGVSSFSFITRICLCLSRDSKWNPHLYDTQREDVINPFSPFPRCFLQSGKTFQCTIGCNTAIFHIFRYLPFYHIRKLTLGKIEIRDVVL